MDKLNKQTDNELKQWADVFGMEFEEIKHIYLKAEDKYNYKGKSDSLTGYLKSETNSILDIYKSSRVNGLEALFRSFEQEEPKVNIGYAQVQTVTVEEPLLIVLENKLGYTLSIESKFISENVYSTIGHMSREIEKTSNGEILEIQTYECDIFNLFIKNNNILKIEEHQQGALNFLRNAQIFKVYMIYADRKEVLTVPWSNNYKEIKNNFQETTEDEEGIFIRIDEKVEVEKINKLKELEELKKLEKLRELEKEYEQEQFDEELILVTLKSTLGKTLDIKAGHLEYMIDTIGRKSKRIERTNDNQEIEVHTYDCTEANLYIRKNDIVKTNGYDRRALNFLRNVQIFKVYLVYADRKEEIAVPWPGSYMDIKNEFQRITEDEEYILINIINTRGT